MRGTYDVWIVALSIFVAIFVSFTALKLAARVAITRGWAAVSWLVGGAVVMGGGIWSMHFIGMLAFSLPVMLSYDVSRTLISLAIAIGISGFALAVAGRQRFTSWHLMGGGILMGAGICAMHYTGMSAIQIVPMIRYETGLVIASIAIAIGASLVGLWLAFRLRRAASWQASLARLGGAVIMGLAISGMHYTAMAASRFAPYSYCIGKPGANNVWLAITVALVALGLLTTTTVLLFYDAHLQKSRLHARQLQQLNAQLRHVATHDPLTAIPNRLLFADRLEQALAQAERTEERFALMVVDLDNFKAVNDSLGHAGGDALLISVAQRLRSVIRKTDTVARLGGDEFVLLMNAIGTQADVEGIIRKVIEHISLLFSYSAWELRPSASIGVAVFPDDGANAETLLRHADTAMYRVKKSGGNAFQLFGASAKLRAFDAVAQEGSLRQNASR